MVEKIIKKELEVEANAILDVSKRVGKEIENVLNILFECTGKIVVVGIGKTGLIGRKFSATLASTGSNSVFLHAAEGLHGDLGIVEKNDVIIFLSYSGNSSEVLSILPYFKFNSIPIIALTGKLDSPLAKASDYVIDCAVNKNSEQFGIIPTSSTTVMLAMGDAISIALLKKKNFSLKDFAKIHPGGAIGKRIFLKVSDLMNTKIPKVLFDSPLQEMIVQMTSKNLGCTAIVDKNNNLVGFFTDGDLRRVLQSFGLNKISQKYAKDVMNENFKSIKKEILAVSALKLMENNKIMMLPVVENKKLIGILHMHHLLEAGIV